MKGLTPPSPFPKRPLVWGSPPPAGAGRGNSVIAPPGSALPGAASGTGDLNQAITSISFAFNYNDNSINVPFPGGSLFVSQPFITAVGIISITLSTSMVNGGTGVLAAYVAKNIGSKISASQNSNIYVEHVVNAGLGHSMRSGMAFSDDVAPRFGSGEQLAVYIADNASGGNLVAGVVTVRYFQDT